jgi:ferredoxin--NADP+ reductase
MEQLATTGRPLRVAIIGSGPAGFYAAETLLKKRDLVLSIDIFNRFPTPFGLVRDGVAPDHQSIKAVIRVFDKFWQIRGSASSGMSPTVSISIMKS